MRRIIKYFLILLSIVLMIGGSLFVWGAYRFQSLVKMGQNAQQQVATVNKEYPYQKPTAGNAVENQRWEILFKVRQQVLANVSLAVRQSSRDALAAQSYNQWSLAKAFLPLAADLQKMANAGIEELRKEHMSLNEYQWLLGLAVREAINHPDQYPAGAGYREVLEKLEKMSRANKVASDDVSTDQIMHLLNSAYEGHSLNDPRIPNHLQSQDQAEYMLDLIVVVSQWTGPPLSQAAK